MFTISKEEDEVEWELGNGGDVGEDWGGVSWFLESNVPSWSAQAHLWPREEKEKEEGKKKKATCFFTSGLPWLLYQV